MNALNSYGNTMTTGRNVAGRDMVPRLIIVAGIAAVLAGPLFCGGSIARAQLDALQPQSAFRLVGTIEGGPFTGAVFDDTKGQQVFYRLNERLPDESRIVKVQSDHIVLKWPDGARTELYATQGTVGGRSSAAPAAAAPVASTLRVEQPAPEPIANANRSRTEQVRTKPSAGGRQDAAGRWTPRTDRQNPDQQGAQVQDQGTKKKGGGGRRNRPRSNDDN